MSGKSEEHPGLYEGIVEQKMSMLQLYSASLGVMEMTQWLEIKVFFMANQSPINLLKPGGVYLGGAVQTGGSAFQGREGLRPIP